MSDVYKGLEAGYWLQSTASRRHWSFIHDCLIDLNDDLTSLGQSLVIRIGDSVSVFKSLHMDYLIEVLGHVNENKDKIKGLKITEQPPYLRHFSSKLEVCD